VCRIGVDLDGCRNVVLDDGDIRASDGALKFTARPSSLLTASENVTVDHCAFVSVSEKRSESCLD
jgi:hypothetical protein